MRHGTFSASYSGWVAANVVGFRTLRPIRQHSASRFHSVSTLICSRNCPSPRHPLKRSARRHRHRFHQSLLLRPTTLPRRSLPACRGRRSRQARPRVRSAALAFRPFRSKRTSGSAWQRDGRSARAGIRDRYSRTSIFGQDHSFGLFCRAARNGESPVARSRGHNGMASIVARGAGRGTVHLGAYRNRHSCVLRLRPFNALGEREDAQGVSTRLRMSILVARRPDHPRSASRHPPRRRHLLARAAWPQSGLRYPRRQLSPQPPLQALPSAKVQQRRPAPMVLPAKRQRPTSHVGRSRQAIT